MSPPIVSITGPNYDGRRDPTTDNDENYAAADGNDDEEEDDDDNDGRSNAGEENEEEDRDHHPTEEGEGYTPLDFNMNEMVPMDDNGDSSDDDGDDYGDDDDDDHSSGIDYGGMNDDDDDDDDGGGGYHLLATTTGRLNGVRDGVLFGRRPPTTPPRDHPVIGGIADGDGDGDDDPPRGSAGTMVPIDFRLLADAALRGLEAERSSALLGGVAGDAHRPATSSGDDGISNENANDDAEGVVPPPRLRPTTEFLDDAESDDGAAAGMPVDDDRTAIASSDVASDDPADFLDDAEGDGAATRVVDDDDDRVIASPGVASGDPSADPADGGGTAPAAPGPGVDVRAIRRALASMRLRSPRLAASLDAGAASSFRAGGAARAAQARAAPISVPDAAASRAREEEEEERSSSRSRQRRCGASHGIIPAAPLAAFRRDTPKARTASASLTRSATLSEAVLRLWPLVCFRRRKVGGAIGGPGRPPPPHPPPQQQRDTRDYSKTLILHILGADGVECSSAESVRKSVGPFVRWMDAALHSGALGESKVSGVATQPQLLLEIDSLLIEFSGPNMPSALVGDVLDLLSNSNNAPSVRLTSAKAIFQHREYHEVRSCDDDAPSADIAVAFNAGIWGYDSWKPTIASMSSPDNDTCSGIGKTIFVITAYTIEECEDDADVVANVVDEIQSSQKSHAGSIARQLWIETNPFSSRCERITASAPPGRKYFENGAWQAWLLG